MLFSWALHVWLLHTWLNKSLLSSGRFLIWCRMRAKTVSSFASHIFWTKLTSHKMLLCTRLNITLLSSGRSLIWCRMCAKTVSSCASHIYRARLTFHKSLSTCSSSRRPFPLFITLVMIILSWLSRVRGVQYMNLCTSGISVSTVHTKPALLRILIFLWLSIFHLLN